MKLDEVKALLEDENPQKRMSAITALRQYEEAVAVPLLASQLKDPEFIIRSFASTGLGYREHPTLAKTLTQEELSEPLR